ncbi:hypothetical protein PY479_10400 [Shewanella sp. A32]|uniref:hypothetical protein n=1 Tax=Shewanella sp. A32 TaxID=3031327 RepID=UPI0023BA1323|nr:hypothetical protein [Shewanella sp. A32]MDF0534681.1 hypothetical protein [Shewanella sp. A32]
MEFINRSVGISGNEGLIFIKFGETPNHNPDIMAARPIIVDPETYTEAFNRMVRELPSLIDPVSKLNGQLCNLPELLLALELQGFTIHWREGWRDAAVAALAKAKQEPKYPNPTDKDVAHTTSSEEWDNIVY